MLLLIPILTGLILSALYPLCFWIGQDQPLGNNFHRFHLGLPTCLGGTTVAACLFLPTLSIGTKIFLLIWLGVLLGLAAYYWHKQYPDARVMTVACVLGTIAFILVQEQLIAPFASFAFAGILGGLILTASLFAMNLGHWYLNVHGLSLKYLERAVIAFWILMPVRLVWDIYNFFSYKILSSNEMVHAYKFLFTLDGFLVWVAVLFGTLIPLTCLYFVYETVRVKSTQSATGILYVILSAVLIGDITYKFYLIKFGLPL